jgi:hypothetical protein
MKPDLMRIAALMSTRLEALRSLAAEIAAGQQACVALDLERLQACDREKERLCKDLSGIDAKLAKLTGIAPRGSFLGWLAAQSVDGTEPGVLERVGKLAKESEAARVEVGRRNEVYNEFLRRARSKLKVMANVVSHCLGVYPAWALPASEVSLWEGGN